MLYRLCFSAGMPIWGDRLPSSHAEKGKLTHLLHCTAHSCCRPFPIRRLSQLASAYEASPGIPLTASDFLQRIHIEECNNTDAAIDTLFKKLPEMCQRLQLQLIVVDSLAGLVRFEYDGKSTADMRDRTTLLFKVSKQLKWLSDTFQVAVVVINQVTAGNFLLEDGGEQNIPALGLAWSHCINTRIILERRNKHLLLLSSAAEEGNDENQLNQRQGHSEDAPAAGMAKRQTRSRMMRLVISPHRPPSAVHYDITQQGVVGIP